MQLSIEAIIVLVIAMVLLGLGIGFIQDFFGKGQSTLIKAFDPLEFGCTPTAQHPIQVSPKDPELRSGDDLPLKICVYATVPSPRAIVGITNCKSTAGVSMTPELLVGPQDIKRTEIGGFDTILTAQNLTGSDLPVGKYICTIVAATPANASDEFPNAEQMPTATTIGTQQVTITVT
jgi:hypothetical protein